MRFYILIGLLLSLYLSAFSQTAVIKINDHIHVTVSKNSSLSMNYKVGPDGTILMDLIGAVKVAGLSYDGAAKLISDTLKKKGALGDSTVQVEPIVESVYIAGSVTKPGNYPFKEGMKLAELVEQAKPTEESDLTSVRLTRIGQAPVSYDIALYKVSNDETLNPSLEQGDQIFVVKRAQGENILILGAVKNPQTIPFDEKLTITSAIAKVGGVTLDADTSMIKLTKRATGVSVTVDISKLDADQQLQPGDQLFVPQKSGKVFLLIKGAVKRTGLIPFHEGLTLKEVIETVQPLDVAKLDRINIERQTENGGIKKFTVNFTNVMSNQSSDVEMKAGDVVEVPFPSHKMVTPDYIQIGSLLIGILLFVLRK